MEIRRLLLIGSATVVVVGGSALPAAGRENPRPQDGERAGAVGVLEPVTDSFTVETLSGQTAVLSYTDYPPGTIVPLSASGCNGRICIYTTGSGLSDTRWRTTATAYYSDGRLCPDTYFYTKPPARLTYSLFDVYINPRVASTCHRAPQGGSTVWSYATPSCTTSNPCSFQDQTKQCNGWEPSPPLDGFPCVTVHD